MNSSSEDIGEKMHRRVTHFDVPWMKDTDSDATPDYPRKFSQLVHRSRLPALGMTTSEEIKRSVVFFYKAVDLLFIVYLLLVLSNSNIDICSRLMTMLVIVHF
jgi:hypothetical protein